MTADDLYSALQQRPFLLAGPCVIESESLVMQVAENAKKLCEDLDVTYVFKASFDKANRTSLQSFRGPGLDEGLKILQKVKKTFDLPIVTDIHEPAQATPVAEVADIIQIPAFLCRQTDLLVAAARTGRVVNIKKAQFLDGNDMHYPAEKVRQSGNDRILLTERGTMLGLGRLVVDLTQMIDMMALGYPVLLDATHATQRPGGGASSGGNPRYAPALARAASAIGVRGFFMEIHPDPSRALSDASSMLSLDAFAALLPDLFPMRDQV